MVIRRFIDSFVPEQSAGLSASEGIDSYFAIYPTKKGYGDLTVLKSAVAGAHLWCERRLRRPEILFSDALQAEIARRGLRIARHHQLRRFDHELPRHSGQDIIARVANAMTDVLMFALNSRETSE
jgi:hypothetical protein